MVNNRQQIKKNNGKALFTLPNHRYNVAGKAFVIFLLFAISFLAVQLFRLFLEEAVKFTFSSKESMMLAYLGLSVLFIVLVIVLFYFTGMDHTGIPIEQNNDHSHYSAK